MVDVIQWIVLFLRPGYGQFTDLTLKAMRKVCLLLGHLEEINTVSSLKNQRIFYSVPHEWKIGIFSNAYAFTCLTGSSNPVNSRDIY